MDEHGAPPAEEDFSTIPLPERSVHKNWRARLSAYTDLIARFALTTSDNDPFFRMYISDPDLLKKWGTDPQVVAQEKGVEALGSLVRESGEGSARLRPEVLPAVIDKTFGSTRASLKLKAFELIMLWIEVEGTAEGVVGDVIKGLDSKQPKIVASSVTCLREIVSSFGMRTLGNPKPLLKTLPKIFGHTDKLVRAEGTLLVQQLHLFIGLALIPFLQELKPIQITELTASFEGVGEAGSGVQKRFTRQQQKENQEKEMAAADGGAAEEEAPEAFTIVPDAAPPIDILSQLPDDFYDALASTKWKERLDALAAVNEKLKTSPNLIDGDFTNILTAIAKRIASDANVNVVTAGAGVVEGLAKGLGKKFGKNRSLVMTSLMERLKERKASVTDALGAAMDAVFASTTFSDILDDTLLALKSKNPQVKEGVLKFLNRSLKSTLEAPPPASVKPLTDALSICTGDSFEPVRAASAESMGLMMKIVGERAFGPALEGLDDMRKTKVKEWFEKSEVRFRAGGAPARGGGGGGGTANGGGGGAAAKPVVKKPLASKPKPPTAAAAAPSAFPPDEDEPDYGPPVPLNKGSGFGNEFPDSHSNGFGSEFPEPGNVARPPVSIKKPVPKPVVKKPAPPPAKKAPPPSSSSSSKSKGPPPSASEPLKYKFNAEEAEAKWEDLIPADIRTGFGDGNWKIRLEAGDKMIKWLEEGQAETAESEVVFRFWAKIPGWNEKNFQVSSKIYGMMVILAERSPSFSKACIALSIDHLTEKLGDMKLKKPAGDTLVAFAEKTSLAFVLGQAFDPMTKAKSPKTQSDALAWVNQCLIDFGVAGIPLRDLIEFLKTALKSSNAAVRASATKTLVTLKIFVGNDVSTFLDDLNPQLLTTINSEFTKVEGQAAPVPTRFSAELKVAAGGGGKGGKGGGGGDPMDELIPRVDLDKLVGATNIVNDSKSDAWKTRKEALETLQAILTSNTRLKPSLGDIGGALKARLVDTNIMVKLLALDSINKIATGMGKPFDKHIKLFAGPVCAILSDAKISTRTAATTVLTAMADATEGIESMISSFGTSLEGPNPLLRVTLIAWLLERFPTNDPSDLDLTPIIGPVISCLEDRSPDVRKQAMAILPIVVQAVGFDYAMEQTSKLKPAMRQTVIPLIQATRSSIQPSASSSSNGSAPPSSAPSTSSQPSSTRPPPAAAKAPTPAPVVAPPPAAKPRGIMATGSLPTASRPASRASSTEDGPTSSKYKTATGLRRPVSTIASKVPPSRASSSASTLAERSSAPFRTSDPGPKALRAKKDASKWVFGEKAEQHHTELLASQMEPHASPELFGLLFSRDHNSSVDFLKGVEIINSCFVDMAKEADKVGMDEESLRNVLLANLDLILKYAAIRMHDSNTQSINRSIGLIESMINDFSSGSGTALRHSFDDYELQLILPTMIAKLGDTKFQVTIQDLFKGKMRHVVPSSKLFQILVAHGLPMKNAKARVEVLKSMTTIIKQSGTGTMLNRDSVASILKCLGDSDGKVRNGALDVLGEAYKTEGEAIYEFAKVGKNERDQMEGRFKHVQGPAPPPGRAAPVARVVSAESTSRPSSPAASRISRVAVGANSPMIRPPSRATSPEKLASPFSPVKGQSSPRAVPSALPRGIAPPGSRFGAPASSRLPTSAFASYAPEPSSSRLPPASPPPSDPFGTSARIAPPRTSVAASQLPGPRRSVPVPSSSSSSEITQAIRAILASDPGQSVDGLKRVQKLLSNTTDAARFEGSIESLLRAIIKQMRVVFVGPGNLGDPRWFRLAKHLIQTLNNFCDHPRLIKEMNAVDMEDLLTELTLRLLETDDATGDAKELSKFINMIILRIFNGGKREVVFKALFVLLQKVTIGFVDNGTTATSREAKHAELILKCIWKRARSVEDDLSNEILDPHDLLRTIEDFLQKMPPTEWRSRAHKSVPMGDMPLRTVKVILQHIATKYRDGDRIYEVLGDAFEDPDNTHVYAYIFRLVTLNNQAAGPAPAELLTGGRATPPSRSESPALPVVTLDRPPSTTSTSSSRQTTPRSHPTQSKPSSSQSSPSSAVSSGDAVDQELQELFRRIEKGDELSKRVDEVSKLLIQHQNKMTKFEELVSTIDPSLSMFVRRAVGARVKPRESESPAAPRTMSPPSIISPNHPISPTSPTYGSSNFQSIPNSPSGSSNYSRPSSISMLSRPASMMGTGGRSGSAEEEDKLAKLKSQFFDPPPSYGRSRAVSQSNESSHSEEATTSSNGGGELEKVKGQLDALRR